MGRKNYTVMLAALLGIALLMSCADVPSTGPEPPVFNSEFRFVHAASDLGNVQVSVDGSGQGSLDFAQSTSHSTYPAGSRMVSLSSGETQPVAMTTDQRATVVIMPEVSGFRELFKLIERRIFDQARDASVRVVNVHKDQSVDTFLISTSGDTAMSATLDFRVSSGYQAVAAGDYTLRVNVAGTTTEVTSATVSVGAAQTALVAGEGNTASVITLADN